MSILNLKLYEEKNKNDALYIKDIAKNVLKINKIDLNLEHVVKSTKKILDYIDKNYEDLHEKNRIANIIRTILIIHGYDFKHILKYTDFINNNLKPKRKIVRSVSPSSKKQNIVIRSKSLTIKKGKEDIKKDYKGKIKIKIKGKIKERNENDNNINKDIDEYKTKLLNIINDKNNTETERIIAALKIDNVKKWDHLNDVKIIYGENNFDFPFINFDKKILFINEPKDHIFNLSDEVVTIIYNIISKRSPIITENDKLKDHLFITPKGKLLTGTNLRKIHATITQYKL